MKLLLYLSQTSKARALKPLTKIDDQWRKRRNFTICMIAERSSNVPASVIFIMAKQNRKD